MGDAMPDYAVIENIWVWLVIVGGPILLGLLIAFALMRQRRIPPAQHRATEQATRDLYSPADRNRPLDRK
ncbi:MAG TPA: hypothetical protein VGN97_17960 [Mesorhizobium sp.]|jgi:hypothetical protein|nr:hypothetical protein [Mesorhizobium sp.]